MTVQRKKPRPLSAYNKQILSFIDQFEEATGKPGCDLDEIALWAYTNDLWESPRSDAVKKLKRDLAKACQQDFITDENGEPVRRRHVIKNKQQHFWFKIENATPDQMRTSAQERRSGALMVVFQIDRDLTYYNKHHNPGDPIQMSFDFDPDVEERHFPTDYPDSPPEDDSDES